MPMYEADEQILKGEDVDKDGHSQWFDSIFHGDIPHMALYVRVEDVEGTPYVGFSIEESIDKEHVVNTEAAEVISSKGTRKIVLNDPLANWVRVAWRHTGQGKLKGVHADLMHAERQY